MTEKTKTKNNLHVFIVEIILVREKDSGAACVQELTTAD